MTVINDLNKFSEYLREKNKVALYGAGNIAHKLIRYIKTEIGVRMIEKIYVTDIQNAPGDIEKIPIEAYMHTNNDELPIIIAVSKLWRDDILALLDENYAVDIVILSDDFENLLDKHYFEIKLERDGYFLGLSNILSPVLIALSINSLETILFSISKELFMLVINFLL